MKVKNFSSFMRSRNINENSDVDGSDKNLDEAGVDGINPPNSGFEGTSAEPMDFFAGDYGENPEEEELIDDHRSSKKKKKKSEISELKLIIKKLGARLERLELRSPKIK